MCKGATTSAPLCNQRWVGILMGLLFAAVLLISWNQVAPILFGIRRRQQVPFVWWYGRCCGGDSGCLEIHFLIFYGEVCGEDIIKFTFLCHKEILFKRHFHVLNDRQGSTSFEAKLLYSFLYIHICDYVHWKFLCTKSFQVYPDLSIFVSFIMHMKECTDICSGFVGYYKKK